MKMTQSLIEKHEALALEIAAAYLDNMASELGRKYKDRDYQLNAALNEFQHITLRNRHRVSADAYDALYAEFQKLEPSQHLTQVLEAFTVSGGSVDIEPEYDDSAEKLYVSVGFSIKDRKLDKIEGLTPMEQVFLQLNAMLQLDDFLSRRDPDTPPPF
jgi:hypothetical protein